MPEMNEWTVMFFFAGDNALSPLIVSQIKAIKDAGFHKRINVLAYFDSNENGAPTRLYDVNRARKEDPCAPEVHVGDGNDPFVRNMFEDNIGPHGPIKIDPGVGPASAAMARTLQNPDAITAAEALRNFIGYCRENFRARHYMLFLVGHGLIVGSDSFLPDDSPESSITLECFEKIIREFSQRVHKDRGVFELLALHSCSMSAIEVAYQLKGTASYMMGSEGISYVGSWPYRQLLKKLFNRVGHAKPAEKKSGSYVRGLISKLFYLTAHNAEDFMLSGYSLDLSLCNLAERNFTMFKRPFQNLVAALKEGLADKKDPSHQRAKEIILLAHLESQSYWQEDYTDIYDLCLCLRRRCNVRDKLQKDIKEACDKVIAQLEPNSHAEPFDSLIVHTENFGSKYQYSHGLSVYFPWSEPIDNQTVLEAGCPVPIPVKPPDSRDKVTSRIMKDYRKYTFTTEFGRNSWFSFLETYFHRTQRELRSDEDHESRYIRPEFIPIVFDPFGPLSDNPSSDLGPGDGKPTPATGLGCSCPSIKNYKTVVVEIDGQKKRVRAVSVSSGLADQFVQVIE